MILRQRGEPELSVEAMAAPKSDAVVNDILLGWCHVHGYAHLRLEGQLTMASQDPHLAQLRESSRRLAGLIQGRLGSA